MTVKDINDIIKAVCPNDEDFEKPCISPKYLRQELEQLALDQRQWNEEPTTKNDLEIVMDAMEYRTNALIENIKSEIMHFANAHCSGDDINIYDVFKVIDDCCELSNSEIPNKQEMPTSSTTKNDLGVDCIDRNSIKYYSGHGGYMYASKGEIDKLPLVTPRPRNGHWIVQPSNKEQGERDFIWWKCSECGQVIYSETEKDRKEFHAFCGRCGAKMVEPQEGEEV